MRERLTFLYNHQEGVIAMMNKDKVLMCLSLALLFLAITACASTSTIVSRNHDYQDGLVSWKCIVNNNLEQETKYGYNDEGDLISIEFFANGQPFYIASYLEYVAVKDSAGKEVRYRYCAKRIHFGEAHLKDWEQTTTIAVINNAIKLTSLITKDGSGALMYRDEYGYDKEGRKTTASRTFKDNTVIKHEYGYSPAKKLGVVPQEYFFETPSVYYNMGEYTSWCTLASVKIPIEEVPTSPYIR
jgi:hypothetical protein